MLKLSSALAFLALAMTMPAPAQNLYDDAIVREVRIAFAQPDWQAQLAQNTKTEADIPATLTVDGVRLDSVGVRYKGNSSYNIPGDKKPFNITTDSYKKGQDLWGYKVFNLNNFFKDPTCVREIIAYRIASTYMYASKAAFVRLYINDVYWGLYLNVQQLSSTFLRESFGDASGNHYKGDPRGDMQWLGPDTARYRSSYELKTNEDRNDWSDLVGFIDKLNNLPMTSFPQEIAKVIDVDRVLWYLAFCDMLVNLDSYIGSGHNYYLYHYPADDRFHIIPWDLNEVLGTFSLQLTIQQREQLSLFYAQSNQARPLVARMLAVPEFKARYIAHFRTMLTASFTPGYWQPLITTYQDLIRSFIDTDTKKLYPMEYFSRNVTENVQSTLGGPLGGLIPGILTMVNNRRAYLTALPDVRAAQASIGIPSLSPSSPSEQDAVSVSVDVTDAAAVRLWWSLGRTAFRMTVMNTAGGNRYSASIPAQPGLTLVRYYVEAISATNAYRYEPETAEKYFYSYTVRFATAQSPVVINEAMPGNGATIKDPQGEYDDWIELHNTSSQPAVVGGMYLSDDATNRTKWKLPEGTVIGSDGYLLVWADDDTTDSPGLHANFKLAKSGEELYLFASRADGNALIDSTSFLAIDGEVSWGRYPNGTGPFQLLSPTPFAANAQLSGIDDALPSTAVLALYPNPVRDGVLRIASTVPVGGRASLTIFDLFGRVVVASHETWLSAAGAPLSIDVAALRPGTYILRMEAGTTALQRMFMVMR
jgi:spore coat protein CotH